MRWYSNTKSSIQQEVSSLAILESIGAITLMLWISWKSETALYIILSVSLAPFLLLRTKASMTSGLKLFWSFNEVIQSSTGESKKSPVWELFGYFLLGALIPIVFIVFSSPEKIYKGFEWFFIVEMGLIVIFWLVVIVGEKRCKLIVKVLGVISGIFWYTYIYISAILGIIVLGVAFGSIFSKTYATLKALIFSPLTCIREIPSNWFHAVFCIDSLHPPELLPGIENKKITKKVKGVDDFKFIKIAKSYTKGFSADDTWNDKTWIILSAFIMPLIFLPALAYRWSLKSSSIIWLPLIWIIGNAHAEIKNINKKLQAELNVLRYSAWARITTGYASIVVIFMTTIPLLFREKIETEVEKFSTVTNEQTYHAIINYLLSFQMHAWHWSRLIVAILTLTTFFYSDKLLVRRKEFPEAGLYSAPYILRTVSLIRIPLSLFTISCGIYLLVTSVDWYSQFENMEWLPFDLYYFLYK